MKLIAKLLIIGTFVVVHSWVFGQLRDNEVAIQSEVIPLTDPHLKAVFSSYQTVQLSAKAIYRQVTSPDFSNEITWQLGKETVKLALYPHDIRTPDYVLQVQTEAGVVRLPRSPNTTYRGWNLETGEGDVRLSITPQRVSGFVTTSSGRELYIQPVQDFGSQATGLSVVFSAEDVISDPNRVCGSTHRHQLDLGTKEQAPRNGRSMACEQADVAIGADRSMYLKFQSNANAVETELIGIKNLMEPNYAAFNVEFNVATVYVVSGSDPWTGSTDPGALLDDFCCWAGSGSSQQLNCTGQNGFNASHDVGELWTNRNFSGSTVGLAWIGTICSGIFKYSVDQHYTTNQQSLRVLIAHECGHNFGANHDGSGSSYIMAPSVNQNAIEFSSASQSAINSNLPDYTCLGSCTPDCPDPAVDLDITSVSAGVCGTPTHSLTLEIAHGGGNGSGFNVNIDGTDYFQNFSGSPQTVVISGLTSNGEANIPISVQAVTSASPNCDDATSYDAPQANCAALDEVVNFNNCQLPSGWTASSTNPYTFTVNGFPDPEWQYQWKIDNADRPFANYDQGNNQGSLLTIDGTCMAYFDDDIASISEYTGVNTLTTSPYNVSDYQNIRLEFDYNFHNFEEGGGGKAVNNSSFRVEVFNGSNWVQVLYDDQDDCPWSEVWPGSCTTHANIGVDAYRNTNFQVRFIYTDGDDGSWTGMIALDNFRLHGDVISAGSCDQTLTITPSEPNGLFQASISISTSGNIVVSSSAFYNAPVNTINAGFEVLSGAVFEVATDGCN